ncbi:MAG: efflux transporter outer membrane subunit [Gammaproteobacteria bacterium]|nr:efflux transporter outer membrane subunit [Gammaproteobacteria bacterium]
MTEAAGWWTGLALCAGLAGCAAGPRYGAPATELPERFDQATPAETAPATLWTGFGSAELDGLIARALAANTTIAQVAARLEETRALSGLTRFSLLPTVTGEGGAERRQQSARDPAVPGGGAARDSFRAGFDAAWEIDLFGGLRRESAVIRRRVEADAAALEAARVSITAETAQAWFALRGARARLALHGRQLDNADGNLQILRAKLEAGSATALDVARAETLARSIAAALPAAEAELVRQEQRLAVLTAWPVAALRERLAADATLPVLPALATTGTPAEWLRRRPDIREAERRLAAATADIGVQVADYFPHVELLGSFGWTAGTRRELGSETAERWSYGPTLTWRFLDLGRVRQRVRAASARADGALAAYHDTVLRALEETENALAGFRTAHQAAAELERAVTAAVEAARLARLRFDAGVTDYLAVLDAERSHLDLEDRHVEAQTRRATALAAIYKSLVFQVPDVRLKRSAASRERK